MPTANAIKEDTRVTNGQNRESDRARIAVLVIAAGLYMGAACGAPKAIFSTDKIDYGAVRQDTVAETVVQINNTGDEPLSILKIQSSCDCITTDFSSDSAARIVQPGGLFALTMHYDTKGVFGERAGTLVVTTNDPEEPLKAIDVAIDVQALVITQPDKVLAWGMAPRGDEIAKELKILPGDGSRDIELIEIHMANPSLSVTAAREETKEGFRIVARLKLAPDVPLGQMTNEVKARVRVSGEEAIVQVPVQGEAVGDVLVMPQSILCAPRLVYAQNQPLSKEGIIVRSSRPNQPLPDVLGAVAVGPIQCIIHKNVKPDWGTQVDRHIIEVRTTENAPPGAQAGTIYVMTTSKDQPVVTIPVFFRMGARVAAEPAHVVLEPANGTPASQRVVLRDATGTALTIREVKFEQDLLGVKVESDRTADATHPAAIVISAAAVPPDERKAAVVAVVTDQPGAERILIPVLIREPQAANP